MPIAGAKKPSRGRPAVDTEAINVRLERAAITKLDNWRRDQPDLPNRPEAIRRLIEFSLGSTEPSAEIEPKGRAGLRPGEDDIGRKMAEQKSAAARGRKSAERAMKRVGGKLEST